MSAQVNTYVLFGVVGEDGYDQCEPYMDDAFKPDVNPKGNVTILFDGMNGEYVAVGHVIAKTGNGAHFEDPVRVPTSPAIHASADDVQTALRDIGLEPFAYALGWHVISHYR